MYTSISLSYWKNITGNMHPVLDISGCPVVPDDQKVYQGPVSQKSRKLFGPEKPFVKLSTACSGEPIF